MIVVREWDSRWHGSGMLKHHHKAVFLFGFIPIYIRISNY